MSIRSGFFNSIDNDRRYDAEDMGKVFEGIISDGVFSNIGDKFAIEATPGTMKIKIKNGKAWFEGKYFEIEGYEEVTLSSGDLNPRIDAICIGINNTDGGRNGFVGVQKGTPAINPEKPTVESTDQIVKKVIGYVTVPANAISLDSVTIESNVGNATVGPNYCPWAETTIDPRHGMYIYDSSTELDPQLNIIRKLRVKLELNQNASYGGNVYAKYCDHTITPQQLGINAITDNTTIICNAVDIWEDGEGNIATTAANPYLIYPLQYRVENGNLKISQRIRKIYVDSSIHAQGSNRYAYTEWTNMNAIYMWVEIIVMQINN